MPPASTDKPRSVELDSLRALAAVSVVIFHVGTTSWKNWEPFVGGFTSHLNVGVTLFFLLSGYLLYRPFARSALFLHAVPSLTRYARHRFLRIAPAYWVALTLLALWPGLGGVFTSRWWVYYGFAQSYRRSWWVGGIEPAWSLSVEVAFYVLMPFFALGLARISRGLPLRARYGLQLSALSVLGVVGIALNFWISRARWVDSILAYLLWFALGMALAVSRCRLDEQASASGRLRSMIAHPNVCWGLALAIYIGIALAPIFPRPFDGRTYSALILTTQHVLYAITAALLMLPAVFGGSTGSLPRRLLANRSLAWLGAISYGIFLWHAPLLRAIFKHGGATLIPGWPFLSLLILTMGAAVLCGWASYRFIEKPAMQLASKRDHS